MKYWKLEKSMWKAGIEYNIEERYPLMQISTDPAYNALAQGNIKAAMKRDEVLVNSLPGKFSVIQKDIQVYKS